MKDRGSPRDELTYRCKKLETQQNQAKELFKALFVSSPIGLYIVQDGKFKLVNPQFQKLSGYSEQELLGMDSLRLVLSDDTPKVRENAVKMLKGERYSPYEFRVVNKEGKTLWVMERVTSIYYKGRRAVLGNFMDITDLKRTEEALHETEERYKMLIQQSVEAIYMFDPETKQVLETNAAFLNLLGYQLYEVRKLSVYDFVAHDRDSIDANIKRILMHGAITLGERVWRRKDGTLVNVHLTASKIHQKGRDIVFAIARDITDNKRAEEALRESEERYYTLFRDSRDAIYITTRDGSLVDVNQAALDTFGYTRKEMIGMNIRMIYANPDEWLKFQEVIEDTSFLRDYEVRLRRKDGTEIDCLLTSSVRRASDGSILEYQGIIRDITKYKQAQRKLEQSMEKLRKAMGGTIQVIALTVETRDPYTAGHQRRVANLARAIATEMGLSEEQIDGIRMAGVVHDLGKISVPAEILSKPGELTEVEFRLIKSHPQVGYDILKEIDFPWPVAQIVLQHHERMDGSGYPRGLKGAEILLEARILGVADVVEAMASHRPYRPALGVDKALEEISKNRGILYDPEAVDACLRLFTQRGFRLEIENNGSNTV